MNYKTIKNRKILKIDDVLDLYFITSNNTFSSNNDEYLCLNENLNLNFFIDENFLNISILKTNQISNSLILRIDYDILLEINTNYIIFSKYNYNYVMEGDNCIFELDNEGILTIRFSKESENLKIFYYEDFVSNIKELTYTVFEGDFDPEFSIGTFDDSLFTIPRQIRQGVPIISTVPSFITSSSSSADISSYNDGFGKNSRTIYFRIVCNKILENSLNNNDLSSLKLKVYLPGGLDTVRPALYVPMYFVHKVSSENISIYRSSFEFNKQGFKDGIEYVDGYMYFDVYVPLKIQKSLGFEFDFVIP